MRPGICIIVTGKPEDYQITLYDVKAFEARSGAIPEGAIVLFATGWDVRWPDQKKYMNDRDGVKHFPGIHPDAAAYLARDRKVVGLGIDTPSVDYGPSAKFETHNLTMRLNVFHIENAARLTSLPPRGFTLVVAPINVACGSGGPTKMFALAALTRRSIRQLPALGFPELHCPERHASGRSNTSTVNTSSRPIHIARVSTMRRRDGDRRSSPSVRPG